jgi:hypothetical protein
MAKCSDGRKHVVVRGYQNTSGHAVARYERSCPRRKPAAEEEEYTCCVCGDEYLGTDMKTILIKGQEKSICPGCADTIHGLM